MTDDISPDIRAEAHALLRRTAMAHLSECGVPVRHLDQISTWLLEGPCTLKIPTFEELEAVMPEDIEPFDEEAYQQERAAHDAETRAKLADAETMTAEEVWRAMFDTEPPEITSGAE